MTNEEFEAIKASLKEKHGCRDCKFNCKDADFWTAPCPEYQVKVIETPDEIRWRKIKGMSDKDISKIFCLAYGAAQERKESKRDFFEVIDFAIKIFDEDKLR